VQDRYRRYGSKAIALALLRAVAILGTAAGTRLLTEVADPDVFGQFKLIAGMAVLTTGVVTAPLTSYAMRSYHDAIVQGGAKAFIADARRALSVVGAGIAVVAVLISVAAGAALGRPILLIAGVAVGALAIATSLVSMERGLLISSGRVVVAGAYEAAAASLLPLAAALAAYSLEYVPSVGMALAQALLMFAGASMLRRLAPAGRPQVSPKTWLTRSIPFAAPLALVGALGWLFNVGDRYLLAALTSTGEVGIYSAAYGLAALPLAALGGLLPTLAYEPLFRSASLNNEAHRRSLSARLLTYQGALVMAGVAVIILFAPVAVRLLLAEDFRAGAVHIIRWVAVGQGFQVAAYALDLDSYSTTKTRYLAVSYSIAVTVALAMNLLLIPRFGALGAAQATAISGFAYFTAMLTLTRRAVRAQMHTPTRSADE
jgi:O-antigen/teichoic acid export membrane protein